MRDPTHHCRTGRQLMGRRNEHVAHTPYGANGIGVSWIRFYFAAQARYPQIDGTIKWLHVAMSSYFEQPVALERLVWVLCENLKEIELARGECFLRAIPRVD